MPKFPMESRNRKSPEGFPVTVYEDRDGKKYPIAVITRHPDCPMADFEEFLGNYFKESQ